MEILQSEVGEQIGVSMKQKFVKQICLLLETIQCHLEGGFFGDWSLDDYVGKIIKARYNVSSIISYIIIFFLPEWSPSLKKKGVILPEP